VDALIPGTDPELIGDWRVLYRISTSDNSVLYFGSRGVAGREEAAIKVLSHDVSLDLNTVERLQVEVDALKQLNNPHIAKLLDYDLNATPAWIATEYLGRKSLETKLRQDQVPVSGIHWWELARAIFSGLSAMHSVNITHRDIKPANIMIDGEIIKIIDFGISYVPGKSEMITKNPLQFEGSRLFAAPENFSNKFTPKMDVFSAAVTLAYAGKLKSIWNDESEESLSESIIKGRPDINGLKSEQIELLLPMLDKYASQRPSSDIVLKKILEYIEHFANSEVSKPVPLRASSRLYRLIRSQRFRVVAALLILASILSILVLKEPEVIYLNNQTQINTSQSESSEPNPRPTIDDLVRLTPAQQKASADCVRLTNELRTAEAVKICKSAAESGDIESMHSLAYNYQRLNNQDDAINWYKKAANAGSAVSMFNLGNFYLKEKDTIEAEKWFLKCVNSDFAICAYNYGYLLEQSGRIPEAKTAYQKGIELGNSDSASNLGAIYSKEQNWAKAKEILLIGAKKDNFFAAYSLGQVYLNNYSDIENACVWFKKATQLKKEDTDARTQAIEICKNHTGYIEAPDVQINVGPSAPYQAATKGSDRNIGDWVILLKTDEIDASTATGVQYRVNGSKDRWQYVFYGYYTNAATIYSYIRERPGLAGACLDWRLVRESKDGYIVQIWEMPKSVCKRI
jgi:serine/threonine protein kinase